MRKELFHMERDVLNIGDSVTIIEGQLPFSYYYTIVPALAMSKNYKNAERIKSREGKVVSKERQNSRRCTAWIENCGRCTYVYRLYFWRKGMVNQ